VAAVDASRADLVIAGMPAAEEPRLLSLLDARPLLKALAVMRDGQNTVLYELLPRRTVLGELSGETLRAAIEAAESPSPVWDSTAETGIGAA
jgi:hypothetical protein